jgi:hypothetical protein
MCVHTNWSLCVHLGLPTHAINHIASKPSRNSTTTETSKESFYGRKVLNMILLLPALPEREREQRGWVELHDRCERHGSCRRARTSTTWSAVELGEARSDGDLRRPALGFWAHGGGQPRAKGRDGMWSGAREGVQETSWRRHPLARW